MRLIDADELRKMLVNHKKTQARGHFGPYMEGIYCGFNKSLYDIETAPTIDAEIVRHGRWSEHFKRTCSTMFDCSVCGGIAYDVQKNKKQPKHCTYRYCPNCGAKMDGGADND